MCMRQNLYSTTIGGTGIGGRFRTGLHFITLALNEAGKFAKSGRMEGISMAP